MQVIITTGGKGGIGKSTTNIMFSDYCIRKNIDFRIVDGEGAQQATVTTILSNNLDEDNQGRLLGFNLSEDEGFTQLIEEIQQLNGEGFKGVLLVDTGASMLTKLLENLDFILGASQELDFTVKILFVVGQGNEAAGYIRELYKMLENLDNKEDISLYFMYLAIKNDLDFDVDKEKDIQKLINNNKYIVKALNDNIIKSLTISPYTMPHKLISGSSVALRQRYVSWLKQYDNVFSDILGV